MTILKEEFIMVDIATEFHNAIQSLLSHYTNDYI